MQSIIQLRIEEVTFSVDRKKLCSISEYFNVMLSGKFAESNQSFIELKEVDAESFSVFMEWLETGDSYITIHTNISLLLLLADRFMVESLETDCHSILCEQSDQVDMLEILETALFVNDKLLETIAVDTIKQMIVKPREGKTNFLMENGEKIRKMSAEAQSIILSCLIDNEKPRFVEEIERKKEIQDLRSSLTQTEQELVLFKEDNMFAHQQAVRVEKELNEFKNYHSTVLQKNEKYVLKVVENLQNYYSEQTSKLKEEMSQIMSNTIETQTDADILSENKAISFFHHIQQSVNLFAGIWKIEGLWARLCYIHVFSQMLIYTYTSIIVKSHLSGLPKHMKLLAERLLYIFPNIINDSYLCDEYYGETALHMAIVSEDPEIVRFLLKSGADVHSRCSGNFFTCDDQKGSRTDHSDQEHAVLSRHTEYPGHLYWGEYPLSFAACVSQEMFKLALCMGADLQIQNRQHLTPFTLAAFLARKEMFEKIIEEERTVNWTYGGVQSAAYPIRHLDSIQPETGEINRDSALAIVVYGPKSDHLQLLPNLLEQLVNKKWTAYARRTLFQQLFIFTIYFLCVMACFMIRPTPLQLYHFLNTICVMGAAMFLLQMHWHIKNVGRKMYLLSLSGFPAKFIFLVSCVLMICSFILRLFCFDDFEDIVLLLTVLLTALKFLFFCRGFKSVDPFVLMLYKIIIRDLMRFFLIYLVIVIGFSQAFYKIFLGYKRKYQSFKREPSIMSNVAESYVRMFIMSLTEFAVFFEQLEECEHTVIGKITFMIYMLLVTLLLINMLIAMMTNTYTEVSGNSLEWLRQWSAIIMMMEQNYDTSTRLKLQKEYSVLMEDGMSKALLLKTRLKDEEYQETRLHAEAARKRFQNDLRRRPQSSQLSRINKGGANYFNS